jgi:enediyne polyketide synthase
LWDPGATDAALHALQVAVPHRFVLPVRATQIQIDTAAAPAARIRGFEKSAGEHTYTFDLEVSDMSGRITQRWTDITFRAVDGTDIDGVLRATPDLAAPYLERVAREAFGDDSIKVAFIRDPDNTRERRRDKAIVSLDLTGSIERRSDGRPIRTRGDGSISIAHHDETTLAIASLALIGCDIEAVSSDQRDLDMIRRHVAYEACRKVGRKPSAGAIGSWATGGAHRIDDVELVTIELPLPSGFYLVAFSRLDYTAGSQLQPPRLQRVR